MPVKCEEYDQVCVMTVDGDLVGDNTLLARRIFEEQIDQRRILGLIVDCEKTGFIDSEGLETLLWMKRQCENMPGQIKLVNLDENCRKILEITRLEHRFESHADLTAALMTMR